MSNITRDRESERGSAGTKFVLIFAALLLLAHGGYNYIPVAYEAESMRSEMSTAILQGIALPGKLNPVDNVKARLAKSVQKLALPPDTMIDVRQAGNGITAHVVYAKQVNILPFGIFKYTYRFDHTATPTGFLMDSTN